MISSPPTPLQITRNTTPAYRTPEMIDMYSNFPINDKQDIWVRAKELCWSQLNSTL